jgi:hypothetical protein
MPLAGFEPAFPTIGPSPTVVTTTAGVRNFSFVTVLTRPITQQRFNVKFQAFWAIARVDW